MVNNKTHSTTQLVLIRHGRLVYIINSIEFDKSMQPVLDALALSVLFFGASLFHWVIVQGWIIAIDASTAYGALAPYPWNIAIQVAMLAMVGVCSATAWVLFGTVLRPWLSSPRAVRIFNWGMALALVASLIPVLADR